MTETNVMCVTICGNLWELEICFCLPDKSCDNTTDLPSEYIRGDLKTLLDFCTEPSRALLVSAPNHSCTTLSPPVRGVRQHATLNPGSVEAVRDGHQPPPSSRSSMLDPVA